MSVKKWKSKKECSIVNVPIKINCDFCNKNIKTTIVKDYKGKELTYSHYEGGEVSFNFGFGSEFDGRCPGKTHICDKCAKKYLFNVE